MRLGDPLDDVTFRALRKRAIFECCKWDPQVEDVATLVPFALLLSRAQWDEIAGLAALLHQETLALERALLARPDLARRLGLERALLRALRDRTWRGVAPPLAHAGPRVMRFDFHLTAEGWRISEVNCDVPGGYVEGSGITQLFAAALGHTPAGDPAGALVTAIDDAILSVGAARDVALVHATSYSDDRQVMEYLKRRFAERGVEAESLAPDGLDADALAAGEARRGARRFGAVMRFFPAEWLMNLRRASGWRAFFRGLRTPATNPAQALIVQSKRLPLVWGALDAPAPTWRALLPETRDVRDVGAGDSDEWVVKPACGRVGADIALAGATPVKEHARIWKEARRTPAHWVAQRRFETRPLSNPRGTFYPCVGVFTLDGVAVGAYARIGRTPLIDHRAQDVALLLEAP